MTRQLDPIEERYINELLEDDEYWDELEKQHHEDVNWGEYPDHEF